MTIGHVSCLWLSKYWTGKLPSVLLSLSLSLSFFVYFFRFVKKSYTGERPLSYQLAKDPALPRCVLFTHGDFRMTMR